MTNKEELKQAIQKFDDYKISIKQITDKIGNICNIGPNKLCENVTLWRRHGVGCCHECIHHTIEKGCSTENLICMAWYCEYIRKDISNELVTKLNNISKQLIPLGLLVRQSKEEQIKLLKKSINQ